MVDMKVPSQLASTMVRVIKVPRGSIPGFRRHWLGIVVRATYRIDPETYKRISLCDVACYGVAVLLEDGIEALAQAYKDEHAKSLSRHVRQGRRFIIFGCDEVVMSSGPVDIPLLDETSAIDMFLA